MNEVALYDRMCSAIAECHRVDEVLDIRSKAQALAMYAKQAKNLDAERRAIDIRLRAERRSGELLRELQRATAAEAGSQGGRGNTKAPARVAGALTSSPYRSALDDAQIPERTAQPGSRALGWVTFWVTSAASPAHTRGFGRNTAYHHTFL